MLDHLQKMKDELEAGSAQLLDVREFNEWQEGHLKQAVFAPLSELEAGDEPEGVDLDKKTYLHCRSGQRVHMAAPLLEDLGIDEVIPLDEGFAQLLDEGFES